MHTIDQAIKKFSEGEYQHFGLLFDAVGSQVLDYFETQCGENRSLAQALSQKAMEKVLKSWLNPVISAQLDEASLLQNALATAERIRSHHRDIEENQCVDEDFLQQLKLKLSAQVSQHKKFNPRYFAYYWHHLRFYFLGGCVVATLGLLAFALDMIRINTQPSLFFKPKLLVSTGGMAFGEIQQAPQKSLTGLPSSGAQIQVPSLQYLVSLQQLPRLSKEMLVARRFDSQEFPYQLRSKNIIIPNTQLNWLKTMQVENIQLWSGDLQVQLDLKDFQLSIRNEAFGEIIKEYATSESAIKKKIKNQISAFGLPLKNYGDIQLLENDGRWVKAFIPLLFDRKEVFGSDGVQKGIQVQYLLQREQLVLLQGYSRQSRETSSYPVETSAEVILERIAEKGILTEGQEDAFVEALPKGSLVYQEQWELLVPMLYWQAGNRQVFVPILK